MDLQDHKKSDSPRELFPSLEKAAPPRPAAYDGDAPFVFLSYAHADDETAFQILRALRQERLRIWYDEGIRSGVKWADYIAEKLEGCSYLIALVTQRYVDSHNCCAELNAAIHQDTPYLVVYLEDVQLPRGLRLYCSMEQAIYRSNCKSEDEMFQKILASEGIDICRDAIRYDTDTPLQTLEEAAQEGIPDACTALGMCYYLGQQVPQDSARAAALFRRAAEQGHPQGQQLLGYCYEKGYGVPQDLDAALTWYCRGAEAGDIKSILNAGLLYVQKGDLAQGYALLCRAAEADDPVALYQIVTIGNILRDRLGMAPLSMMELREMLWRACKQGYGPARDLYSDLFEIPEISYRTKLSGDFH